MLSFEDSYVNLTRIQTKPVNLAYVVWENESLWLSG